MITFLGHAGFLVETDYELILMDPWFNPLGAFDSGWFQFPKNHDLAPDILAIFATSEKAKYVYVSHEHQDHFDLHFLKQLELYKFTYLIPFYRRDILLKKIKEITQNNIILFQDEQVLKLSQGYIKIYIDDQELNRDSAILVNSDGFNFLNLNDCKIPDRLPKIKKEQQKIHAFTAQFSGATWHPTCYKYPQEEYNRISSKKMEYNFESI